MRKFLTLLAFLAAGPAMAAPVGDDGLHKPAWLRDTFKDLREDAAEAAAEGRRLVLLVEQRGCIYCDKMHGETFPDPRVEAMIEENYFPVQINLHGDIEIVDTDGESLSEKAAARKWGVLFTPTVIFLPAEVDGSRSAVEQAVSVMPGAFGPGTTLDMFTWVHEERYLDQSDEDFQRYHARKIRERDNGRTD